MRQTLRWLPLWLLPHSVWAASLGLVWNFPRGYQPQPAAFVITYTDASGQNLQQMSTPPSAVGVCAAWGDTTPDAYCTAWPTCPPPGVVTFWVQAAWSADTVSERSDPIVVCLFTVDKPCVCQDPGTYTPPTTPQPVPVPPLPPTEIPPVTTVSIPSPPPFTPSYPPTPT